MSDDSGTKWLTLFDNMNAKAEAKKKGKPDAPIDLNDIPDIDEVMGNGDGGPQGNKKRLSVERIYQKKSQLEHILLRPDTYIGSVEKATQPMWVYDDMRERMVQREITYVPGLYKIFDEILVNAADNKQRDPSMNCIKIDIDPENNKIKIWNNGKGIPVVEHKTEKMYVPTLIFGHLLTSSNYDDTERKVTGGRNGYGAKLCNIFSKKFTVETSSSEYKKAFKQTWENNMGKSHDAKIVTAKGDDYTCVTFYPDLSKFKMDILDKDIVDLFSRRAYDVAGSSKGVKVFLNGKRLAIKGFKDYVDLYIKDNVDDNGQPLKVVYESTGPRWEVAVTLSDKGFQQVSFVNSIATTKGGKHTDVVADQIVTKLIDVVKKKQKKGDNINIKPFQVRTHIWVFVNCLIENPTFDSQTKENMTLQAKSFGSKCSLSDKFFLQASKCGIIESIMSWMKFKAQEKMNQKCSKSKHSKLKGIPKLDDANDAGTKNSGQCTLILTEGDSAKSLAVAGLGVVGRDKYGVFPLKGKLLNVREASAKQIMENAEINNLIKIIGLRYKETYENPEQLKTLRYGRLMIMTDQDQDGSHIKGLLINFIHHNWPNLLKHQFVEEFITPIVKIHKGQESRAFYSLPEFEEWKRETANWHTWKVKYYKGLGTSTAKEAKEYFSDMLRHRIPFKYGGTEDDASIVLAFSKKKIEERKEWLTNWMDDRKRRSQLGLPELYLYGKQTKHISYTEFVNRELILFSNMDNERSIPGLIDGLKPGQRKVLFTCLKRNLNKEIKVAQLAGSVSELSAYHHGEMSLMGTIIGLAQNYVGSNNINLLQPIGQFGTRLHGGKDAASPRYIFTALSPLTRLLFSINDDPLLKHLYDDNQKIEPEFYCPIIPMVLVNGADGIGTGWSTKIPNYDPREIMRNLRRLIDGQEQQPMLPSFKNFKGTVEAVDEQRYCVSGEISIIDDSTLEITELPIRTWTQVYKEGVLEPMLQGTDKTPPMITDYKEYHTDTTVRFVIKMSPEKLRQCELTGLHKVFKLQTSISIGSMVLFDSTSCIRKYTSVMDIMQEFFTYRLDMYQRRKDYLEGMLAAESLKLDNQARFILEKIEGKIVIENKAKKDLVKMLVRMGFDSDPVRSWKEAQDKLQSEWEKDKLKMQAMEERAQAIEEGTIESDDEEADSTASSTSGGPDFNYILSMALWCLTKEKKDELLKQRDQKSDELYALRKKTPKDLWRDDMNKFEQELNKVEQKEREEEVAAVVAPTKTAKGRNTKKKVHMEETMPSPMGRRVEPRIDPALRAKSEAAANRKKKALKKKEEGELEMFAEDDEGSEIKSLAERIGNSPTKIDEAKGKKAPAKKRERKPPAEKKSPAKKGKKKKNPWDDSDESMGSNLDESDMDDLDDSFKQLIPRSRGPGRAAATKAKYTFSDEEEEDGDSNFGGSKKRKTDDDDDFFSSLKSKGKSARAFSDSEDDSQPTYTSSQATTQSTISSSLPNSSPPRERSPSPAPSADPSLEIEDNSPPSPVPEPPKKAPAAKKPAATKRKAKDGEAKPKKKAAPRKKQMTMFDSSDEESKPKKRGKKKSNDSDDEFHMSPKKAPAKKKKAKGSDDDSDDFTMPSVTASREHRGRKAAPVKYKFSDDEDDDSDF